MRGLFLILKITNKRKSSSFSTPTHKKSLFGPENPPKSLKAYNKLRLWISNREHSAKGSPGESSQADRPEPERCIRGQRLQPWAAL